MEAAKPVLLDRKPGSELLPLEPKQPLPDTYLMKATTLACLAISLTIPLCNSVLAQSYRDEHDQDRYASERVRRDQARVTRVERISYLSDRYSTNPYLPQECWDEHTHRHETGYYRDESGRLYQGDASSKTTRTLIGAIIGGALGNQVGSGDGRTAATIAGAVIGAQVGKNSGQGNRDDRNERYDYYRDSAGRERRCRTVGGESYRDAYRVSYSYSGRSYQAITDSKPGRTIRVLVDVRPEMGQLDSGR